MHEHTSRSDPMFIRTTWQKLRDKRQLHAHKNGYSFVRPIMAQKFRGGGDSVSSITPLKNSRRGTVHDIVYEHVLAFVCGQLVSY